MWGKKNRRFLGITFEIDTSQICFIICQSLICDGFDMISTAGVNSEESPGLIPLFSNWK